MEEYARVVLERLENDRNMLVDAVLAGTCKNFDEYRAIIGEIRGVDRAKSHMVDILKAARRAA